VPQPSGSWNPEGRAKAPRDDVASCRPLDATEQQLDALLTGEATTLEATDHVVYPRRGRAVEEELTDDEAAAIAALRRCQAAGEVPDDETLSHEYQEELQRFQGADHDYAPRRDAFKTEAMLYFDAYVFPLEDEGTAEQANAILEGFLDHLVEAGVWSKNDCASMRQHHEAGCARFRQKHPGRTEDDFWREIGRRADMRIRRWNRSRSALPAHRPRSSRSGHSSRRPVRRTSGSRGDPPDDGEPRPSSNHLQLVPPPAKRPAIYSFGCISPEERGA
jgi:hypothetical protein